MRMAGSRRWVGGGQHAVGSSAPFSLGPAPLLLLCEVHEHIAPGAMLPHFTFFACTNGVDVYGWEIAVEPQSLSAVQAPTEVLQDAEKKGQLKPGDTVIEVRRPRPCLFVDVA